MNKNKKKNLIIVKEISDVLYLWYKLKVVNTGDVIEDMNTDNLLKEFTCYEKRILKGTFVSDLYLIDKCYRYSLIYLDNGLNFCVDENLNVRDKDVLKINNYYNTCYEKIGINELKELNNLDSFFDKIFKQQDINYMILENVYDRVINRFFEDENFKLSLKRIECFIKDMHVINPNHEILFSKYNNFLVEKEKKYKKRELVKKSYLGY